MKYPYLLFDADDTLFDFPQASLYAFSAMCEANDVPNTKKTYQLYFRINQELWAAFDRDEVTREFLLRERYVRFLHLLSLTRDPDQCNRDYLTALGAGVFPLPHAEEVCRELAARGHRMYIATNATATVQRSRLRNSVFAEFFHVSFISEEIGVSKPHKAYYEYIFSHVPEITVKNTLVIGDSLSTDIRGANNAGLPCCWFNPSGIPRPNTLRIDYEISDLRQLLQIV